MVTHPSQHSASSFSRGAARPYVLPAKRSEQGRRLRLVHVHVALSEVEKREDEEEERSDQGDYEQTRRDDEHSQDGDA